MTDITTKEETESQRALSPRQIELRDGVVDMGQGVATRRTERLLHLERELSRQQSKQYEMLRLRDHVFAAHDVGEDIIKWNIDLIARAVARSEQRCAELQTEITTLRGAR